MGEFYYCEDCKSFFPAEEIKEDYFMHSELAGTGGITYETFGTCPVCGSDQIYECEKCDVCGDDVAKTYFVAGKYLCEFCANKLHQIIRDTQDRIVGELGVDALDAEDLIADYFV